MRRSTGLFFILALVVGFVLFKVKYEVIAVEQKLAETLHQTERENENIHILKAEWSHLNEPQRLQKLAEKYLDIVPTKTDQIVAISNESEEKTNFNDPLAQPHLASMKGAE